MAVNRRDFLKASSALAAAFGLEIPAAGVADAAEGDNGGPTVIWLEAQGCSGCSVSLLNSIYYATIDELLLQTLNLKYHPTVMAASGALAVAAAEAIRATPGYVLIVEGAVSTGGNGNFSHLWPGLTSVDGIQQFAANAGVVLAVGSCSAYGGVVAGSPNPTGAQPLQDLLPDKQVINIPGCPAHPDWVVGTVAHLITNGTPPTLDSYGRPEMFFANKVHSECPNLDYYFDDDFGRDKCLFHLGCKGPQTRSDCPTRRWHSPAAGEPGINWCIGAQSPCIGCVEPGFPDDMSPFNGSGQQAAPGTGEGPNGEGVADDGDNEVDLGDQEVGGEKLDDQPVRGDESVDTVAGQVDTSLTEPAEETPRVLSDEKLARLRRRVELEQRRIRLRKEAMRKIYQQRMQQQ